MFDTFRHYQKLARTEPLDTIPKLYAELSIKHKKHLVGIDMAVPREITLHLDDTNLVTIVVGHDARIPVVGEGRELLSEADGGRHIHRSHSPNTMSMAPRTAVVSASMWPFIMKSIA